MLSGMQKPKRPRDANQLGKFIVDLATGATAEPAPKDDGKKKLTLQRQRKKD